MTRGATTGLTTYTTPNERDLVITRAFAAPRPAVFHAWTSPPQVSRWLLGPEEWTMPICEIDLRPGGPWRYLWRKADGREMSMNGSYREVRPPERAVWTERWGHEWPETINTLDLTEAGGLTIMTLTATYPHTAAREAATQTGMKDGIERSLARLDQLLTGQG